MAKAYWVACYHSISNADALAAYAKLAGPAIQAAGGRFLARGTAAKAYEAGLAQRVVLIEFDSVESAVAAHDSDGYQKALKELDRRLKEYLFAPDVRPAGPVALGKGESKKVKHFVEWKLYDKDELVIRLLSSDPSVKVPAEIKVPADQPDFEYEVTAGQQVGEFTITVAPALGKAVFVRVNVK